MAPPKWGWASSAQLSSADSFNMGASGMDLGALNAASLKGFWDGPEWEEEGDAWDREF